MADGTVSGSFNASFYSKTNILVLSLFDPVDKKQVLDIKAKYPSSKFIGKTESFASSRSKPWRQSYFLCLILSLRSWNGTEKGGWKYLSHFLYGHIHHQFRIPMVRLHQISHVRDKLKFHVCMFSGVKNGAYIQRECLLGKSSPNLLP